MAGKLSDSGGGGRSTALLEMTLRAGSLIDKTAAFQAADGGANPTPALHFSKCLLRDVSAFIKKYHYSHTHPGGIDFSFRLEQAGVLSGACCFGWMAGNPKATPIVGCPPEKSRELMRLVLLDEVPKNSESRFIGWCLRWLKSHTDLIALVSFADPVAGHSGIVYRATNWEYVGLQKPIRPRLIIDGKEIHPRQAVAVFGTSSVPKLRAQGKNVELRIREQKHKFVYRLR